MARIGIIIGDETIKIAHEQKGILYKDLAYVNWNPKKQEIIGYGNKAKMLLSDPNNSFEIIKLFDNGKIVNTKVFKKLFDEIFLPLKNILQGNDLVIGIPTDSKPEIEKLLKELFKSYEVKSLNFFSNIYLLAIGCGCNVEDSYGTILLNFGYGRTSVAIIADNKIINFTVIPWAEDYLTSEILIFFKEYFQLIINQNELNQIKYDLASLMINKQAIQLVLSGKDLVTNLPKELTITNNNIRKIFTSLFTHYRSTITKLLEGAPTSIRTGVTKNGLIITGNMAKIHGVKDYFTDFFEFPTTIINEKLTINDALKGALSINLDNK